MSQLDLHFVGDKLTLFKHLHLLSETPVHGDFKSVLLFVVALTKTRADTA